VLFGFFFTAERLMKDKFGALGCVGWGGVFPFFFFFGFFLR